MLLLDLLFPKRCVGCGKVGKYICSRCLFRIRYLEYQICPVCMRPAIGGATHPRCKTPQGLDGMVAAAYFEGVIRKVVHTFKYRYVSDLTDTIADILVAHLPKTFPPVDYLLPVPLHPKRLHARGFNQSALLAKAVGQRLTIPITEVGLHRIKETKPQFGLHREERKTNMLGAFSWKEKIDIQGKSLAIVDDVATTTATVSECAKVLKRNGAKTVWSLVLAHG